MENEHLGNDTMLSPREAGDYCGVNRTTVTSWIKKKGLKARRLPSGYFLIRKKDLDRFLSKYDNFRKDGQPELRSKILIVDDEDQMRVALIAALEDEYEVLSAPSGNHAIKVAREEKPDIVLLDIMMPQLDGYDVCRALKENRDTMDSRIIFISAKTAEDDTVKGLDLGADDYIRKPFGIKELISRIENVLKRA